MTGHVRFWKKLNNIDNPLISVIIPVYNVEKYIEKCIDSVCKQTYSNLEIIIIDDGSTDGSGKLCDKWQKEDDRIIVLHKRNSGQSGARNAGLDISKGDYIAFVDSDDYILPNMYEELLNLLRENHADIAHCDFQRTDEELPESKDSIKMLMSSEEAFLYCAEREKWSVWCSLYSARVWEYIRFTEGRYFQDAMALTEVMARSFIWAFTTAKYYVYNVSNVSTTRSERTEKHLFDGVELLKRLGEYAGAIQTEPDNAAYFVWCTWMGHFGLAMRSKKLDYYIVKEAWNEISKTMLPMYGKVIKSSYYRSLSFRSKMRIKAFRYAPVISQMLINRKSDRV